MRLSILDRRWVGRLCAQQLGPQQALIAGLSVSTFHLGQPFTKVDQVLPEEDEGESLPVPWPLSRPPLRHSTGGGLS
jgi:hypothetical protein